MGEESAKKNRLISLFSLILFSFSLLFSAIIGWNIYLRYRENEELKARIVQEYEHFQEVYEKVDGSGYYDVYSDGDYIVYGNGGAIIIDKNQAD